jgi:CheY-like chemotaxis protein
MPFIDGTEATRLIRTAEENGQPSGSQKELGRERIPIIAVSASLKEHARHEYASAGFDGWILKPIDFQRLESILAAAKDESLRKELTYAGGRWSMGGWLGKMDG